MSYRPPHDTVERRSCLRRPAGLARVVLLLGATFLLTLFANSADAQGWIISGQVVDAQGVGVAGVDIDIFDNSPTGNGVELVLSQDFTLADGTFALFIIDAVPVGSFYDFTFTPPVGAPLFPGALDGVFLGGNTSLPIVMLEEGRFLSGRVVDAQGTGLEEVDLDFFDPSRTPFVASGDLTDAAGDYSVLLPPGTWTVEFLESPLTAGGPYVPVRIEDIDLSTSVTLPDVVLELGYPVSGTVEDSNGFAVLGADIDVVHPVTGDALLLQGDNTDASGAFSVLVPSGPWIVEVEPPPGLPRVAQAIPVDVTPPSVALGTIVLPEGVVVTGITVDGGANPVPNVDLDFIDSATQVEVPVGQDNANGSGQFAAVVTPGTYDIAFRPQFATGLAPVLIPAVSASTDITLGAVTLPVGFVLSGTVTGQGFPVADVELSITEAGTGDPVYTFGDESGANGTYAVRLAAGIYDLVFAPLPGSGWQAASVLGISVGANTVVDVDLDPAVQQDFIRGDANRDLGVNLGDAISILEGLFGTGTIGCPDAADVNDDGNVDISDPIFELAYLFSGGPTPATPFPDLGTDPTADTIGCP